MHIGLRAAPVRATRKGGTSRAAVECRFSPKTSVFAVRRVSSVRTGSRPDDRPAIRTSWDATSDRPMLVGCHAGRPAKPQFRSLRLRQRPAGARKRPQPPLRARATLGQLGARHIMRSRAALMPDNAHRRRLRWPGDESRRRAGAGAERVGLPGAAMDRLHTTVLWSVTTLAVKARLHRSRAPTRPGKPSARGQRVRQPLWRSQRPAAPRAGPIAAKSRPEPLA